MSKLFTSLFLSSMITLGGCGLTKEDYYVKHIEFPRNATLKQKIDMVARPVPTPQQAAWQQMELTAFLHFGINTFAGREWGDGQEDSAIFNPTEPDAEQWVRTLKDTGFRVVLPTVRHHDGFCLWPTAATKRSVASSPWKNGRGGVMKELRNACDKYDMEFRVYLSPWNRNAECHGDSPKYNEFFIRQLTELLTNYNEIYKVWFDGANGEEPGGKKQIYDWDAFYKTIQQLQLKAVIVIIGDDVRWVGNREGLGCKTEWSATVLTPGIYARSEESNKRLGVFSRAEDLGSRVVLGKATELFWYPSGIDVSIRPGWFYHVEEGGKVRSLRHLTDIYSQLVGYSSVLSLNIPPNRRGLINEADVQRLNKFAAYRGRIFTNNRIKKGRKGWEAVSDSETVYSLKPKSEINVVVLQGDITKGQQVGSSTVEALTERGWQEVAKETTVGYKRMVRFPAVKTAQLRVKVNEHRLTAHISQVIACYVDPLEEKNRTENWNNLPRASWKQVAASLLTINLGKEVELSAFTYAPLRTEAEPTMAFRYKLYVSADGKSWKEVPANGEFSNIIHNPLPQTVTFGQKEKARFIKLEATTPAAATVQVEMNEIEMTVAP